MPAEDSNPSPQEPAPGPAVVTFKLRGAGSAAASVTFAPAAFLSRFPESVVAAMFRPPTAAMHVGRTEFDYGDRDAAVLGAALACARGERGSIEKPAAASWEEFVAELDFWQIEQPLPLGLFEWQQKALVSATEMLVQYLRPLWTRLKGEAQCGVIRKKTIAVRVPVFSDEVIEVGARILEKEDLGSFLRSLSKGSKFGEIGDWMRSYVDECNKLKSNALSEFAETFRSIIAFNVDHVLQRGGSSYSRFTGTEFVEAAECAALFLRIGNSIIYGPYTRFQIAKAASAVGVAKLCLPDRATDISVEPRYSGRNAATAVLSVIGFDGCYYFLGREINKSHDVWEQFGRDLLGGQGSSKSTAITFRFAEIKVDI